MTEALPATSTREATAGSTPLWRGLYRNRETLKETLRAVWSASRGRDPESVDFASLPAVTDTITPDAEHARAFALVTNGDPAHFEAEDGSFLLPPTYASTWGMRLTCKAISEARIKLPVASVLHAGNRIRFTEYPKAGEPIRIAARLKSLDRTARRTILTAELVHTRPDGSPLFTVEMVMFFPGERTAAKQGRSGGRAPRPKKPRTRKARPRVPYGARAIDSFRPTLGSIRRYTAVSGDFNPVHVSDLAAKASGFPRAFIHGYATKAIALHAVIAHACGGDPTRLVSADVRFTKPLLTKTDAKIFLAKKTECAPLAAGQESYTLAIGPGPGEAAILLGTVVIRT